MVPVRPFQRENWLRYGIYYASRLLPHPSLRRGVVALIRRWINARHGPPGASRLAETPAALTALRDSGVAPITSPFSTAQLDDILGFLATAPVARPAACAPVTASSRGVSSAVYGLATILACPHLLEVMNHPGLLEIAAGFLGCKPTISGAGLRWSFATGGPDSEVQKFHRDAEDWKILRLFVYLTDVFADCGPHQFVQGSHKTAGRLRLRPYSDQDIDQRFGGDRVLTVSGPRGTAFMGDMWGVHRGMPPTGRPRLLFSCTYTMTGTPIYRYEPVKLAPGHAYDPYINRLLIC